MDGTELDRLEGVAFLHVVATWVVRGEGLVLPQMGSTGRLRLLLVVFVRRASGYSGIRGHPRREFARVHARREGEQKDGTRGSVTRRSSPLFV